MADEKKDEIAELERMAAAQEQDPGDDGEIVEVEY